MPITKTKERKDEMYHITQKEARNLFEKDKENAFNLYKELSELAGLWSGYPIGQSYIDSRANPNWDIRSYVNMDGVILTYFPQLAGKRPSDLALINL